MSHPEDVLGGSPRWDQAGTSLARQLDGIGAG